MKAKLLKEVRSNFKFSQRGNLFSHRIFFHTYDGTSYRDSEWSNKEDIIQQRRNAILEYVRKHHRIGKTIIQA